MSLSIEALRRRLSACMNLDARRLSSRLHGVKKLPEAKQAAMLETIAADLDVAEARYQSRLAGVPKVTYPGNLPVSQKQAEIARAMLSIADRAERLVTIEDARELHLPHENSVALIAERGETSERTPAKLLVSALRMRPDRLILGEMRGEEALAFLEAINTGHPGSISTIRS